ncbi:hypothetical protein GCM10027169_31240 [Gordonia jinhuaensis]|uniref:citrate synthase (unknown stereospecificity) n=1 Tax=Gordonia jinhuaensis TaxID=1517702 RepID=A0A916T7C0_9ACTN|nr:hypothetical protein GCM10011489_22040 [Gordonia jinhuaensis]
MPSTAAVPSTAAAPRSPTTSSIAASLWPRLTTLPATRPRLRLLNSALVCLADHDMSAGAVAARVAASARGGPYAVIGAGLGALDGPVHGGAATLAQEFLRSALDDPRSAVLATRADGRRVPGTGHRVYQRRDPRAEVLRSAMGQIGGGDRRVLPAIDDIADMVAEQRDFVNSDMLLAGIALRFSMVPHAAETIFAVARISGWAAHAIEEYGEAPLRFRPQGIYVGARS